MCTETNFEYYYEIAQSLIPTIWQFTAVERAYGI